MNHTTAEPGVPFPMKLNASGPEAPFPLKIVNDVLGRDYPLPVSMHWPDAIKMELENWQKTVMDELTKRFSQDEGKPAAYPELIGRTLEVVRPGGGARFIDNPNRIVISIDQNDHIVNVSVGSRIHRIPEGS